MKNFTALNCKKHKWILLTALFLFAATFLKGQTVVDVIANSENHTQLEHAILESGLDATLSGEGSFTVFAPTDDAIDALFETFMVLENAPTTVCMGGKRSMVEKPLLLYNGVAEKKK